MTQITPTLIKEVRERTGAGMADCKKALTETDGNVDKAMDYLRKKGLAAAAKKAGRVAAEGAVASYIHSNGRVGVLLEVNCETDFVARSDDFQNFCKEVSLQIAAMNPMYVRSEEIDPAQVEKERSIHMAKAKDSGKPEQVIGKIVDGQVNKWKKEICLLDQSWVKDDKKTISNLLTELVSKVGENCQVRRFVRFEVGEGMEKRSEDFAAEVARAAGAS